MNTFLLLQTNSSFFAKVIKIAARFWPLFWHGIKITLLISLSGTIIGLMIGLVVGAARAIKVEPRDSTPVRIIKRVINIILTIYVEVFRGTPMIVQAMFLYYTLKQVFGWTPITAGICIISINTGAYMAEIIRAGIQSVNKGQTEAARSIGMSSAQAMLYVVIPQAVKNAFPAIGNEFVINIKDSSVLNVISVTDLYFQSMSVAGSVFMVSQTFFITAFVYLVLTFTTTRILHLIENRMKKPRTSVNAATNRNEINTL